MAEDLNYIIKLGKKIIYIVVFVFSVYICYKLAIFYMPFIVAFIISLLIEPIIKFFMKKSKLSRKTSSIILFILVFSILISIMIWGIVTIISESTNLLETLNLYIQKIYDQIQNILEKINSSNRIKFSNNIIEIVQNGSKELLDKISISLTIFLTKLLNVLTSLPTIMIYIVITVLSIYFICTDKIYILDLLEHHMPKRLVRKVRNHVAEIGKSLGCYLKAQVILVIISFIISVIGLYLLKFTGLNIKFPLLIALGIGFVDALPILGSGTVMVPWAIISALNGDLKLGISVIVLWIIMSIIRQILEPRIVSGNIGIHPIFTIIAMYTGFKIIGILGMLVGPIILIILKNVFGTVLEQGITKSILDKM